MERHSDEDMDKDEELSQASDAFSDASLMADIPAKLPTKLRQQGDCASEDTMAPLEGLPSSRASVALGSAITRLELQDELRIFARGPMRVEVSSICQKLQEAMNELEKSVRKDIKNMYGPDLLPVGMNGHGCKPPLDFEGAEEWASPGAEDHSERAQQFFHRASDGDAEEDPVNPKHVKKPFSRENITRGIGNKEYFTGASKRGKKGGSGRNSLTKSSHVRAHSVSSQSTAVSRQTSESATRKSTNLWRQRKTSMSADSEDDDSYSEEGQPIGVPATLQEPPVCRSSLGKLFNDAMGGNGKVAPETTKTRRPSMSNIFFDSSKPAWFSYSDEGNAPGVQEPPTAREEDSRLHRESGVERHKSLGSHDDGHFNDGTNSLPLFSDGGASYSSEDDGSFGFRHRRGFILSEEFRKQEGLIKGDERHAQRLSSVIPVKRDETSNNAPSSSEELISVSSDKASAFRFHDKVRRIVESAKFDYASAILIITNAILLGIQTDYVARHLNGEEPLVFFVFDRLFCVAFTSELIMRLYVHRLNFIWMHGWKWNVFDIFIVGIQIVEEIALYVGIASGVNIEQTGEESSGNFGVLRILRVLRLVRIIRLARIMHLIEELRTIVVGIFSSMQSLFWTLVLLFLIIYIIAVYITQTVSDHLLMFPLDATVTIQQEQLITHFGSVPRAILTLYQSISGGMSWSVPSNLLMHSISPGLAILFSVYIGFSIFCLMNITTGVFVESALETAKTDRELFLLHHAHELFRDVDIDGTGTVTWEEFRNHLDKPEMQMYFQAIDLDPDEAEDLFTILDVGGNGHLDVQEFVNGCLRLRGPAKAVDLASFMHEYSKSMKRVHKTVGKVEKTVQLMARCMMKRRQTG